jgi:arylformamidase
MIADEASWPRARLDADYTARACCSVEDFERTIGAYHHYTEAALAAPGTRPGVVYDPQRGLALDLYGTVPGESRPLVMFIHGGYWRALSRGHSGFMAPMLAARGIATAAIDYRLAPAASMTEIVEDVRRALAFLWHGAGDLGIDRSRIIATGSSAGGHLVGTLMQPGWQQGLGLPDQPLHAALPVSGLFELAPIAKSHVQEWMALSPAEVATFSPLRHLPARKPPKMLVAVAETETSGFHRQSEAYAKALDAPMLRVAGRHHFDVILDMMDATTRLGSALVSLTRP